MNNMNGAPIEKPVDPVLAHFNKICEQFDIIPKDGNWNPEIEAEIAESKKLIAEIKETSK